MLLSIVLIKYKYFNFAQGSRLLTILIYSYTIKNNISLKYHLLWKCVIKACTSTLETKVIVLHTSCLYFGNWSIACKINIGIMFVENPPGIYELTFLFSFHSWRNNRLRFLYSFVILHPAFESCNNIWIRLYV